MEKRNYHKEMQRVIACLPEEALPRLLLHSCCAPCSSSVLEQLAARFSVTVLYYNPNIWPREEYERRKAEQIDFIRRFPFVHPVDMMDCAYEPGDFYEAVRGLEQEPERGGRCSVCYRLRIGRCAREAARGGYDYFTTTLSLSPLKDAERINQIGFQEAARLQEAFPEEGVPAWLPSDFKKGEGYKRSLELSRAWDLYRQDYCGCEFSRRPEDLLP